VYVVTFNRSHTGFKDCASLPNAKHLFLDRCDNLYDIDALLGKVIPHELDLAQSNLMGLDCTRRYQGALDPTVTYKVNVRKTCAESLEAFHYAHELDISDCQGLSNPTIPYPNVRVLIAWSTPITDFSLFTNLRELDLQETDIDDVSALGHLDRLVLKRCNKLRDVRALGNVRILDLSDCYDLEGTEHLTGVERLNLENTLGIPDLAPFANAFWLNIQGTGTTQGLAALRRVPILIADPPDNDESLVDYDSLYVFT
jgi:hypothetical protein